MRAALVLAAALVSGAASADVPPTAFTARIVRTEIVQADVVVVVNAGTTSGVDRKWSACVIDVGTQCLADGKLTLVRIDKTTFVAKTRLTVAQLQLHGTVRLAP